METVSALVRRVDEDRWLASRFAPALARAKLEALYAVNYEIARTAEAVRTPMLGDIRLAWWREALEEIHAGKPARVHPALQAYARAFTDAPPPLDLWAQMIAARHVDLEPTPFARPEALVAYIDATAGAVMRLAAASLDTGAVAAPFIPRAARAWGFTGLLRAGPIWAARGRRVGADATALKQAALKALDDARGLDIAAQLFPAVGYVALTDRYLRDLSNPPPLLERQVRLVIAAARTRL